MNHKLTGELIELSKKIADITDAKNKTFQDN
jgi:hypothetical protein